MKTKYLIPCMLVLSVLGAYAQTPSGLESQIKTFRNSGRFSAKYDKFKDHTHVSVGPFFIGGTKAYISRGLKLEMSAHFFQAQVPVRKFYLVFESKSRNWTFLRNRELYILADGKRLAFGEGAHDADVGFRRLTEILVYELSRDEFTQIANAQQAELKVGSIEITLKDEHKEAFRDLLSLTNVQVGASADTSQRPAS